MGLFIEGLKSLGGSGSLAELAITCDRLDHTLAPVVFLTPAGLVDGQDERGKNQLACRLAGRLVYRNRMSAQVRLATCRIVEPCNTPWQQYLARSGL